MNSSMLSDDELDRLLSEASWTRPVNPAAGDAERVDAALADLWQTIGSSGARQARSRSTARPVYRRRLAAVGVAAAAVGVASLVGVNSLTGGSGGGNLPLAVSPAAAAQLERVAHAAAAQPGLSAGQWEYVEITSQTSRPGNRTETEMDQHWYGANGTYRERLTVDGTTTTDVVQPLAPVTGVNGTSPTGDPQTLLSEISAAAHQGTSPVSPASNPYYFWSALQNVLLTSTSTQLRATAFAALSYVPGTKVLGSQTDSLGRTGTAISSPTGSDQQVTIIVSPSTGHILESYDTLTAPWGGSPAGTVLVRATYTHQGVVDADTALPGGGSQPLPASSAPETAPATSTSPSTTAPIASTAPDASAATR